MKLSKSIEQLEYSQSLESDKEAIEWLDEHGRKFGQFIGGEFLFDKKSDQIKVINPSDSSVLASIEVADDKTVDLAVSAAAKSQKSWYKSGGHARAKVLYALARLIQKHSRVISVLETLDNGKPIRESRDADVPLAIRHFYYHAGGLSYRNPNLKVKSPLELWPKSFHEIFRF